MKRKIFPINIFVTGKAQGRDNLYENNEGEYGMSAWRLSEYQWAIGSSADKWKSGGHGVNLSANVRRRTAWETFSRLFTATDPSIDGLFGQTIIIGPTIVRAKHGMAVASRRGGNVLSSRSPSMPYRTPVDAADDT